ncbi:hypothetical protein METP1_02634 [Methanosarcinales archaeon]|nr:hypothetical protein METP1_02634 [Methanosarcinales archaeon]
MIFQSNADVMAKQVSFQNFEPGTWLFFIIVAVAIVLHRFVYTKLKISRH